MNAIFKKLNYRDTKVIFVLQAPKSFQGAIDEMKIITGVKTSIANSKEIAFLIAFVKTQREVDDYAGNIGPRLEDDAIFWFAYPKKTSKKYKCEFNRDTGWGELGRQGYEPVRMIAIDEDWSALRFRKAVNIKTMTRGFAMTEAGKKKVATVRKDRQASKGKAAG